MPTSRSGKSLGSGAFAVGLLPPLDEHEDEEADDDTGMGRAGHHNNESSNINSPAETATSAQSPVSRTYSLGAGSLDLTHCAQESTTPSLHVSNKSAARTKNRETDNNYTYRHLYSTPTKSDSYDEHDDDDAQSVQSVESVRSAASAASVSSSRSLGVGSLLPLIEEEEEAAAAENDHTPTASNKARHPICDHGAAVDPSPLLGVNISHHSSSNEDLLVLPPHAQDDAISVLSGHSASLPPAATEPFFLSHRDHGSSIQVEPIRQRQHHAHYHGDDTSTFVSGITLDDAGGESPIRLSQQRRQHSAADDGTS
mmetsp:Transcript_33545/g.98839  ORF Transcript_33545/g.98839 Transcript_33545/m.98839 type:complete len:312 (-) Transcript_33545:12-947(-)